MGRYYAYTCDCCGKTFGKDAHLNISSVDINMSYFVPDKGTEVTPGGGKWQRKNIIKSRGDYGNEKNEFHFCDLLCLAKHLVNQPAYLESVHGVKFDADAIKSIEKTILAVKPKAKDK